MSIKGLAICLTTSILALAAAGPASGGHSNDREQAKGHKQHSGDLVKVVREATWRYRDRSNVPRWPGRRRPGREWK